MFQRVSTVHPFGRVRTEMDRLFESVASSLAGSTPSTYAGAFPAINAWEDGESVFVEAELPGMSMNDVDVTVHDGVLSIKGSRAVANAASDEKSQYLRRERSTGAFQRSLRLPVEIDADKVEAWLTQGVLTVKLPKAAAVRPRKIEVKSRA